MIIAQLGYCLVVVLIATVATRAMVARSSSHQNTMKRLSSNKPRIDNALAKARQLVPPQTTLTSGGENEHAEFWQQHDALLKSAWDEWWDEQGRYRLPSLRNSDKVMIQPALRQAVERLHQEPTLQNERELKGLFRTVIPNQVYQIPLFTPEGVRRIRQHVDAASYYYKSQKNENSSTSISAGIPTRRPNGMNRFGIILSRGDDVEGAVSYDGINDFMEELSAQYIRPLGRTFFNSLTSRDNPEDDSETYAFTIRYQPEPQGEGDLELKEHSDASIYTLNINLNLVGDDEEASNAGEQYEGSSLYFVDEETNEKVPVKFEPGQAYLHRGLVRHAALPITAGERHNLVVWLFGKGGYVRFGDYEEEERLNTKEIWGNSDNNKDTNDQDNKYKIDPASITDL